MIAEKDENLNRDNVAGRHEGSAESQPANTARTPRTPRRETNDAGFPPQQPAAGKKALRSRNLQFAALALAAIAVILIVAWIWP